MTTFTYAELATWANHLGAMILTDHYGEDEGYWILDRETREGVWEDENFCTSLAEVTYKLYRLEDELVAKELAGEE